MTHTAGMLRVLALSMAALFAATPPPASADFSRAELEQMLAPVALYPDSVLSHILIAATYPDEVEEAARWSRRHPDLSGEDAVDAVEDRNWDPSVKALVAFPDILARMDEDPDWTERLGDAFLDQEAEVMDSVQTLRDRAYDAGHLRSTEHVHVVREREYIYIEPAVHHVVYVPYYDPWYVYGNWWWPSHPPYRWRHWHGHAVSYYGTGFYWGVGFRIAPTFYFTSFYWPERHVVVTHHRHANYRPLYSGRHVTREHRDVRHWRGERPAGDVRRPRSDAQRHDRGPAAASRPDDHPGRGPDLRRGRNDDQHERRAGERRREDRDETGGGRTWRAKPGHEAPEREQRRAERGERASRAEPASRHWHSDDRGRGNETSRERRGEDRDHREAAQHDRPQVDRHSSAADRAPSHRESRGQGHHREARNGRPERDDDRGRGRDASGRGEREGKQNGRERSQRDR